MRALLSDRQKARSAEFESFVAAQIAPHAADWDRDQHIPNWAISRLAQAGYLGGLLPPKYGGQGWDVVTFGLLNEAVGRSLSSLCDLLTVQSMVSMSLLKWGTSQQKARWLPLLGSGEIIGAFALTEPSGGSDLQALQTEFIKSGDHFILRGEKTWVSFAQSAGLFLVVGQCEGQSVACLLPRETPGIEIQRIDNMMAFRAAGLGRVRFHDLEIPPADLIGKPGLALTYVVPVGLLYGRISTACSALGLLRGCFEESLAHAAQRRAGKRPVADFGMIQSMLARMGTDLRAAGMLCYQACVAADQRLPEAYVEVLAAKYFSSTAAVRAAADAVQIKGAAGCHDSSPVARYYRDAKVMEIIEGTSQVHEELLARSFLEAAAVKPASLQADALVAC
jgi:alkylation response protein AidB-like acyl-CoA dehydrogenase